MRLGYHASHEQFPPEELLGHVQAAQWAGFHEAMCSDHFAPFLPEQGHSGHAWNWLGAALQATGMTFGTVSAAGYRYHPAILAQAAATAARMSPGRFWLALGSGEALNEHITGTSWPSKEERNARMKECHGVIRRLWKGETVSHEGRVRVDRARLWSLPEDPPSLLGAAMGPETAAFLGGWTDGLITVNQPLDDLERTVAAYRDHGGEGPLHLQVQLSWHPDRQEALRTAHRQWRFCAVAPDRLEALATPEEIEAAAEDVDLEDLLPMVEVVDDLAVLKDLIGAWEELGFDVAYLHQVGPDQRGFLQAAARELLPAVEVPGHAR